MGKPKKTDKSGDPAFPFTIQGEWFPGGNPEGYDLIADPWRKDDETALETESRLFGAATRFAFNRLLDGMGRAALKVSLQKTFGLNSRYADDCLLKAKEIIDSQKKLIPVEIEGTQGKLAKTQNKLKNNRKKERKLREKGAPVHADQVALVIKGQEERERKLAKKLAGYEAHQKNGTIPKVIFGGKKLWRDLSRGRAFREDWRAARRCRLYSRGDEAKGGDPNMRIGYDGENFSLSTGISHLSVQTGQSVFIRQGKQCERNTVSHAPRVEGRLWIPPKFRMLLWEHLLNGKPYAVELIRGKDGRFRAHVSFTMERPEVQPDLFRGVLGFDTNPDGLAVYSVDASGNREPFPDFGVPQPTNLGKFAGEFSIGVGNAVLWLKVPELTYARGFRRDYLIGVLAKVLVDTAKALGKPLAGESLDFKKDHDTNRAFNRMSSNFPYAKTLQAVARRCRKEGVAFIPVNPAYTSVMGLWKYAKKEGVSSHQAAAKVISRRAMGLHERFDPDLRKRLAALREQLVEAAKKTERQRRAPGEGKRRSFVGRPATYNASLLEERLVRCNGHPPWRRTGRGSPWGALVLFRRYRWIKAAVSGVCLKFP